MSIKLASSCFIILFFGFLDATFASSNISSEILSPYFLRKHIVEINTALENTGTSIYGVAKTTTPVFSSADLGTYFGGGTGGTLILDDWNQIDPLETTVYPRSVFHVQKIMKKNTDIILQVTTPEYPYDSDPHYIDSRFVKLFQNPKIVPKSPKKHLPSKKIIISRMKSILGVSYIWGGAQPLGIPELRQYYPMPKNPDAELSDKWQLKGVDCSGLLYWATNGFTPRNTSKLITFGTGVDIEGKTAENIAKELKPLDIIVWKGHNQIVIDQDHVIESTVNFSNTGNYTDVNGVRIVPLVESLTHIIETKKRTPVNDWDASPLPKANKFVIRRWYP